MQRAIGVQKKLDRLFRSLDDAMSELRSSKGDEPYAERVSRVRAIESEIAEMVWSEDARG